MFADQSDKWHHSMCRYLGVTSDTSFLFGIIPGVCREVVGRRDFMYTQPECFNSKLVYSYSEYHHEKINKSKSVRSYYGTSPFLWDLGITATKKEYEPKGSLFFIPRDDQVTIRDPEWQTVQEVIDSLPKPITFLLPWRDCDIWTNWYKLEFPEGSEFKQMNIRETRQFTLSDLLLKHEYIYIPWPGTDIYYSEFLDRKVVLYDDIKKYRTKTVEEGGKQIQTKVLRFLKWGYDYLNDTQKEYFHWQEKWNDIPVEDRRFLTTKTLGLNVLKSPEQLFNDMKSEGFLQDGLEFKYNEDYQKSYEWLKAKSEKFLNSSCSKGCADIYAKI